MSVRFGRLTAIAGFIIAVILSAAATPSPGQSGKPEYKPEVEEVAREIFFEILSPY